MTLRIYVEGGGEQNITKSDCRQAFRLFFEKIIPPGSFKVIASGGRSRAFEDFCIALKKHSADFNILLVDSEAPVTRSVWDHLRTREGDRWEQPSSAGNDQAHLMVQSMEAWFLADREVLIAYYGSAFLNNALPNQPNVELIPKAEVLRVLEHASRPTTKGTYHKTYHGFDLLERIRCEKVAAASSHAKQLFDVLVRETNH